MSEDTPKYLKETLRETPVVTPLPGEMRLPHGGWVEGDTEICSTCGSCELYCSMAHEKVSSRSLARLSIISDRFTGHVAIETCRQCAAPDCVYACKVPGAMTIDPNTKARLIDAEKCVGCGACAKACPYNANNGVIRLDPERNIYIKCDLCGGDPQCIKACRFISITYEGRRI